MKGKLAVTHAKQFLASFGFVVSDPQEESANGHDLVAIKGGRGFTFEVKPAIYKQRAYRVRPVSKKTSDGIIIVFPGGYCLIDSMKNHLSSCSKSGSRFLSFVGLVVS